MGNGFRSTPENNPMLRAALKEEFSKGHPFMFMGPEIFEKASVIRCGLCLQHGLILEKKPKPTDCTATWECKSCSDYQKVILIVDECGDCNCSCGGNVWQK